MQRFFGSGDNDDDNSEAVLPRQTLALLGASLDRLTLLLAPPGALMMPPFVVK